MNPFLCEFLFRFGQHTMTCQTPAGRRLVVRHERRKFSRAIFLPLPPSPVSALTALSPLTDLHSSHPYTFCRFPVFTLTHFCVVRGKRKKRNSPPHLLRGSRSPKLFPVGWRSSFYFGCMYVCLREACLAHAATKVFFSDLVKNHKVHMVHMVHMVRGFYKRHPRFPS